MTKILASRLNISNRKSCELYYYIDLSTGTFYYYFKDVFEIEIIQFFLPKCNYMYCPIIIVLFSYICHRVVLFFFFSHSAVLEMKI